MFLSRFRKCWPGGETIAKRKLNYLLWGLDVHGRICRSPLNGNVLVHHIHRLGAFAPLAWPLPFIRALRPKTRRKCEVSCEGLTEGCGWRKLLPMSPHVLQEAPIPLS